MPSTDTPLSIEYFSPSFCAPQRSTLFPYTTLFRSEIDRRLVSLRTRAQALTTRSQQVDPVLSELRRRFTVACWQDLQRVPEIATENVRQAEAKLAEARTARQEQRWADATALLSTVRALLNTTDEAVSAAGDRLQQLNAVQKDPEQEIERTRFAIRDAQRL